MSRVVVTREKLKNALLIWLRVMPKHVWRQFEAYERKAAEKRQMPEDEPKAREEMADYIADQFVRRNWEITHAEPKGHG
jgi:hypothetical protein